MKMAMIACLAKSAECRWVSAHKFQRTHTKHIMSWNYEFTCPVLYTIYFIILIWSASWTMTMDGPAFSGLLWLSFAASLVLSRPIGSSSRNEPTAEFLSPPISVEGREMLWIWFSGEKWKEKQPTFIICIILYTRNSKKKDFDVFVLTHPGIFLTSPKVRSWWCGSVRCLSYLPSSVQSDAKMWAWRATWAGRLHVVASSNSSWMNNADSLGIQAINWCNNLLLSLALQLNELIIIRQ